MSTTIRVGDDTKRRLAALASSTGKPMTVLVAYAVDELERKLFFEELNSRYDELRSDADAWEEIEAERGSEERVLPDTSG